MKAIVYCVVGIAIVLTLCFVVSLVRSKTAGKKMRWTNLILPLLALLLFVGLFVGSGISRSNLRRELGEMKENTVKSLDKSRLTVLEERNKDISLIIGRDKEVEKQIEELQDFE